MMYAFLKPFTFILLILLLISVSSCEEDDSVIDVRTRSLAGESEFGRTWQISGIEIELGTVDPHACVKDNNFTYYPNDTYEVNEGKSKCDPGDPPAWVGHWLFNRSKTQLTIEIGDSSRVWSLEHLSGSVHKISSNFDGDWRTYDFRSAN